MTKNCEPLLAGYETVIVELKNSHQSFMKNNSNPNLKTKMKSRQCTDFLAKKCFV